MNGRAGRIDSGMSEVAGKSLAAADAAQVDTVQNHMQSGRIDLDACGREILQIWKLIGATLQKLVPHGKAVKIPIHAFDSISALVFENKERIGQRVEMHGSANDSAQSREAVAHVDIERAQENTRGSDSCNHGRSSFSARKSVLSVG